MINSHNQIWHSICTDNPSLVGAQLDQSIHGDVRGNPNDAAHTVLHPVRPPLINNYVSIQIPNRGTGVAGSARENHRVGLQLVV